MEEIVERLLKDPKSKSTKPSRLVDGTPCSVVVLTPQAIPDCSAHAVAVGNPLAAVGFEAAAAADAVAAVVAVGGRAAAAEGSAAAAAAASAAVKSPHGSCCKSGEKQ